MLTLRGQTLRGLIGVAALTTLAIVVSSPAVAQPVERTGPPTVTPDDLIFQPRTLRTGSPVEVGLIGEQIDRMATDAAAYLEPTSDHPNYPSYAGAVVLGAKDGVIVQHAAVGHAVRYSGTRVEDGKTIGVELPRDQWVAMRKDSIFDMASVSKLFCTVVALQLVERGQLDLDATVASYIPEFAVNGKGAITVRQLFTHTSGMRPFIALYSQYPTPEARIAAVYASTLQPGASPGNQYIYSDLGLITLGKITEKLTGKPLDQLVAERITGPLGMTDTMYNPPAELKPRIAATEEQPWAGRPLIHGEVHDENAWSLGGVAGHAGIFSTAADLAVFCQMLLNGGVYGARRILAADTVRAALVNYNAHLEPRFGESDRGLGFELHKHWYMGPLASPVGFGHTGYTGTSLSIDPIAHSFVIFLSNRVHPSRTWGGNNQSRRAMTRAFGYASPVRPAAGRTAWRADWRDGVPGYLTAALSRPASGAALSFGLWYDTETGWDKGRVEVSTDGGATWSKLPFSLLAGGHHWSSDGEFTGYQGRQWARAHALLPDGVTHVRWAYLTDGSAQGRGMYVDGVLAADPDGAVLNSETPDGAKAFTGDGFRPADT
ncbi:MAG: serine hydrolase [Micromonosporaceae bacterium]